jgi:hypothetical protein
MLLVHVADGDGVGEQLVQVLDAHVARGFVQCDWQPGEMSVRLRLVATLVYHGPGLLQNIRGFGDAPITLLNRFKDSVPE